MLSASGHPDSAHSKAKATTNSKQPPAIGDLTELGLVGTKQTCRNTCKIEVIIIITVVLHCHEGDPTQRSSNSTPAQHGLALNRCCHTQIVSEIESPLLSPSLPQVTVTITTADVVHMLLQILKHCAKVGRIKLLVWV